MQRNDDEETSTSKPEDLSDRATLARLATEATNWLMDVELGERDRAPDRRELQAWAIKAFGELGAIRSKAIDLRPVAPGSEPRPIDREVMEAMVEAVRIEEDVNRLFTWAVNPKQVNRATAWLHVVVNTLIEGISNEVQLLDRGSVSFRFNSRRLEHLRPIQTYLPSSSGTHVLRDFRAALAPAVGRLDEHDASVEATGKLAEAMLDELMSRETFLADVELHLREYEERHPEEPFPGGAFSRDRFPGLVAERLINDVRQSLHGHTDQEFWDEHGEALREKHRRGDSVSALDRQRDALVGRNRELLSWLEMESRVLCDLYDLPAAPTPNPSQSW